MIPSALVAQLQQGMKDFLRASFWSTTAGFDQMIEDFVEGVAGQEHPLFRGPYISVKLPFEVGEAGADFFEQVPMSFAPYRHQEKAFRRLGGEEKHNTLVATGTGSGKTESFLFPILAHCERFSHREGIKAVLIYPMNALAQDQAERIAALINENEHLRSKVRAGLYVGSKDETPRGQMGAEHIITDKEVLQERPPDILLTNYKMLDYLMIRPKDQRIWEKNGPQTLQFLVVDELHTFDGAQGTDLACLIRRLKARLKMPAGHLTCVGTSATLGDAEQDTEQLLRYAGEIFGEDFDEEAVVREHLQDKDFFLYGDDPAVDSGPGVRAVEIPSLASVKALDPARYQDREAYLTRQQQLWFGEELSPVELGRALREHHFLERLVHFTRKGPLGLDDLCDRFMSDMPSLKEGGEEYVRLMVVSLLTLIAYARDESGERPFLQLRLELWQREMRRMVATVHSKPRLRYYDDLTREQQKQHLPVIYCRECGTMGWATMIEPDRPFTLSVGIRKFYQGFFSADSDVAFFFPRASGVVGDPWFVHSERLARERQVPDDSVEMENGGDSWFEAVFTDNREHGSRGLKSHRDCPACEAGNSLSLLGFQAATLTSAYINQLFASRFNDDKKLLTFSDSVQDAAHRAGFFEGRTWRFNLRVALQKVVDDAVGDVPLAELPRRVVEYWRGRLDDEEFVAAFIAPDMVWLQDYEALTKEGKLPKKSDLINLIERRLSWEIFSEYSMQARIGRALARTGASIAYADRQRVEAALTQMVEPLRNEVGGLQKITEEHLRPLVAGLLRRLLLQGALYQPELHETYLKSGGEKTYTMSQQTNHLPNFGPYSRLPVFLASRSGTTRFDALSHRKKQTWYDKWFARCMESLETLVADEAAFALRIVLGALVKAEVLKRKTCGGTHLWGFRPDALWVSREVAILKESESGAVITVAEVERDIWEKTPAMGPRGGGHEPFEGEHEAYYARLYAQGDLRRIVAEEHSGLLERATREEVERRFKSDEPRPWYPNLLSCTPTLEMGVDVGDLSTAILCSVPPSQANYLQRIGRAGRRDGNAVLLTLATAREHDLYFFQQPEEMIAGSVEPPGVFLSASAVLERQLTAYCFDCWAASDVKPEDLPTRLGTVLDKLNSKKHDRFPLNLLRYIESHETILLKDFLALFEEQLSERARAYLVRFMRGGEDGASLRLKIMDAFEEALKEKKSHEREARQIQREIKKLKAEQVLGEDQKRELQAMEDEQAAWSALLRQINARRTMEFLTDEGLLPNYAFPEAGVILKSVIWRRRSVKETKGGKYETFDYEYERPASQALVELAPGNRFYAGGRQVEIDRVGLNKSHIETWQFCDSCHHAERLKGSKSEDKICPSCRSDGFGDAAGQIHKMLRLRQVYANTNDKKSRISDDREERQPTFYNKQLLLSVAKREGDEDLCWLIDDEALPFGYEFIARTRFREINFGESSSNAQSALTRIAGKEGLREGFGICVDCGMIQSQKGDKKEEKRHSYGCPSRRRNHKERLENCLFLYREFEAESVHILLPFTKRPGFETKIQSFIAAFQMGLKEAFGGQVDHLQATSFTDPGPENSGMRQFLVLFDRIPGGTGYLKDLMRPTAKGRSKIFAIFEEALQILNSCGCQYDPTKDGCYRCLLAYRNSFDMPETSREVAMEVLRELLQAEGALKPVESLGAVRVTGALDSALEARFLETLHQQEGAKLIKDMVQHRSGYRYQVGASQDESSVQWEIIPQVNRRKSDGLATGVSIDFLFESSRLEAKGRPVAVFTDGFQFHGHRVGFDLYQRMAMVQSGQGWAWSLSWQDVEEHFEAQDDYFFDLVNLGRVTTSGATLFDGVYQHLGSGDMKALLDESSLPWLQALLTRRPSEGARAWQKLAMALASSLVDPHSVKNKALRTVWREELASVAPAELMQILELGQGAMAPLTGSWSGPQGATPVKILVSMTQEAMLKDDPEQFGVLVWMDDSEEAREAPGYQKTWNGVLRLFNVMQFLPNAFFVTKSTAGDLDFGALIASRPMLTGAAAATAHHHEWKMIREEVTLVEPSYGRLVDLFFQNDCPLPEAGYPLVDRRGRPTDGIAELAWEQQKVALVELHEDDFATEAGRQAFESQGWTVFDINAVMDHPAVIEQLIAKLLGT